MDTYSAEAVAAAAAAAIAAFDGESELTIQVRFQKGLDKARMALDDGRTAKLLKDWVDLSQSLA